MRRIENYDMNVTRLEWFKSID